MRNPHPLLLLLIVLSAAHTLRAQPYDSAYVRYDNNGKLDYTQGSRIPDFGYAGYNSGRGDPPTLFDLTIEGRPRAGSADDTAYIQGLLDNAATQTQARRPRVLLKEGLYWIDGTLRIPSGVVLSGEGAQRTVLRRRWLTRDNLVPKTDNLAKRREATVVRIGQLNSRNGGSYDPLDFPATDVQIVTASEPLEVGSRRLMLPAIARASFVTAGADIVIGSRATSDWIARADPGNVARWRSAAPGTFDLGYQRKVTRVDRVDRGSRGPVMIVTLDAPVFSKIDQPQVFPFAPESVCRESGLEHLTVTIDTQGPETDGHAILGVHMVNAENCWVRGVIAERFSYAGVRLGPGVTRSSVLNCQAIDPHAPVAAAKRYNFAAGGAQLVLFEDCYASKGRHSFASNGGVRDSGVVFLECRIDRPLSVAEPHRRWSQGVLYDSVRVVNRGGTGGFMFALSYRADEGASDENDRVGHGWTTVNSVLWRCTADGGGILVQNPPLGMNYAIGCSGDVTGTWQGGATIGLVEHTGRTNQMRISSLYRAQRGEAWPGPRPR